MIRQAKNKKAQLGDLLTSFFSYIAFIMIVLLFFVIFKIAGCNEPARQTIEGEVVNKPSTEMLLLNFLRTPATIGGKENANIADLIALYISDRGKYEEELKKQIYPVLGKFAEGQIDGYQTISGTILGDERALKKGMLSYYLIINKELISRSLYVTGLMGCLEGKCPGYNLKASSSFVYIPPISGGEPIEVLLIIFEATE